MPSIWEMLGLKTAQPVAQARMTRTPIFNDGVPEGMAATYQPGTDAIHINPNELQRHTPSVIPHEEAHVIFDRAQMKNLGANLAGHVGEAPRNFILASPVYKGMNDYGSNEQLADEGLGRSIGDPDETAYVKYAASQIKDPKLAAQLLRLHSNAIGGRKAWEKIQ